MTDQPKNLTSLPKTFPKKKSRNSFAFSPRFAPRAGALTLTNSNSLSARRLTYRLWLTAGAKNESKRFCAFDIRQNN